MGCCLRDCRRGKLFRFKYRFHSKEKLMSFGKYPTVSLKEARRKLAAAKEKLSGGIDPMAERAVASNTFEAMPKSGWRNGRQARALATSIM